MLSFFTKKVPPNFVGGRGDYALSSYLFLFLKVSTLIFAVQSMTFQVKLPNHCLKSYSMFLKSSEQF